MLSRLLLLCDLRRAVIVGASIRIIIHAFNFIQTITYVSYYGEEYAIAAVSVIAVVHAAGIFFYIL